MQGAPTLANRRRRTVKYQACVYTTSRVSEARSGLARVKEFDLSDVEWIIDAETGRRINDCWNYRLKSGPMAYLQTEELGETKSKTQCTEATHSQAILSGWKSCPHCEKDLS